MTDVSIQTHLHSDNRQLPTFLHLSVQVLRKALGNSIEKSYIRNKHRSLSKESRDSSVGIATRYGLDGPGIESLKGPGFFAPAQTGALGPPQPPVKWETGPFPECKAAGAWR
jgi:hypothetical protein